VLKKFVVLLMEMLVMVLVDVAGDVLTGVRS